jgi:hypothetical protein
MARLNIGMFRCCRAAFFSRIWTYLILGSTVSDDKKIRRPRFKQDLQSHRPNFANPTSGTGFWQPGNWQIRKSLPAATTLSLWERHVMWQPP